MIDSNQKTSLLIPSQLPAFIRDDPAYGNFVLFLQAYYEWMEQNNNVTDRSKNLLNYKDIDNTADQFLDYFYNDFLAYFPKDILADKQKVIKLARELYQSKGTPASYQFLFKVLYNSDVDFFYTKDAVLRASAGKWYVAKSLKLASDDPNFLNISNLRIFGESTKSIATIENSVFSGTKTEVFISNIERLFQSGEFVRVVDSNNQDVLFNGQPLRAKIVGQISQLRINPNYRGLLYRPGDPVIVYNGLSSNTGHGATAVVNQTTSGAIQRIKVEYGGYGYTPNPSTLINITNAPGALAIVGGVNTTAANIANVTFVPTNYIGQKQAVLIGATNYFFSNVVTTNANTSFANTLTFTAFPTYPISSVIVQNGGGGIIDTPVVSAISTYPSQDASTLFDLSTLGILSPIQIINGGNGYQANDVIIFSGGSGYGAHANVISVSSNGAITDVRYVYGTSSIYPLGGMGFINGLPTLSVSSANTQASNAVLTVNGTLGTGAIFTPLVDRVGSITSITITDPGEDYISTPNVSFKVQDIVVTGLNFDNFPSLGDIIYQGSTQNTASYVAIVDSVTSLINFSDPLLNFYNIRVYNYTSLPNYSLPLKIDSKSISVYLNNTYKTTYAPTSRYDNTGVITYGDGTAKGTASFLNGLVLSSGQYLDTTGQPSSYDILQSSIYNNFTYEITLEKEIEKYRKVLLDLLHPTGMNVLGRYALKSNSKYEQYNVDSVLEKGHTLGYYTGNPGSYATMSSTWTNQSNNIVNFYGLSGANLINIIVPGDSLTLTLTNGFEIHSEIANTYSQYSSEDFLVETGTEDLVLETGTEDMLIEVGTGDFIVLKDNVWLTFANVSYITANAGSNVINITSMTGSYDIVNNGNYSNTACPLQDIVFVGDKVLVANNTERVVSGVNYMSGIIYLTSNLTNAANSFMSVQRTVSTSSVRIDGFVGIVYYPEMITEDGNILTTEDGRTLLIG